MNSFAVRYPPNSFNIWLNNEYRVADCWPTGALSKRPYRAINSLFPLPPGPRNVSVAIQVRRSLL